MDNLLCNLLGLYLLLLVARIILSWFPIAPESPFAAAFSVLYAITEPVLGPVRRLIPPMGIPVDFSPLIVIFGVNILQRAICR